MPFDLVDFAFDHGVALLGGSSRPYASPSPAYPGQILGRLIEVQFLDRTVILAAQAFSAILPLFIVVSTVSPHPGGDSPATILIGKLGLGASEMSSLQTAVVPPHRHGPRSASWASSSSCSPRPASPGPCSAAISWPGGCRRSGCAPPGASSSDG